MIKIEYLMIGDFVEHTGRYCRVWKIENPMNRPRWPNLDNKKIVMLQRLQDEHNFIFATEDELNPIPISKEIMEKNMFYQNEFNAYHYYGKARDQHMVKVFEDIINHTHILKYVHDVQNFFRASKNGTLNFIADNFNI